MIAPRSEKRNPPRKLHIGRLCAALCGVALLAVVVAVVAELMVRERGNDAPAPEQDRSSSLIAEQTPSITLPEYKPVLTNEEELVVLPNGVVTNKPKTIAEAIAMVRLKPGFHRYKSVDEVFAKTNDFQIGEYKQPLFKTHIENHLAMMASMPKDRVIPPMPPLHGHLETEFAKALDSIIALNDDDDEADVQTKIRVSAMKEQMRFLVDEEGMSISQAYHEIEREHNRLANLTELYKGAYRKMVLTGDEDAAAFLKVANEKLRREGACEFDEEARTINP